MRLTADGALAVHHDAEIPGLGAIAELEVADLPAHVPAAGRRAGGLRGHGGQRRDQERPPGPGLGPRGGRGGADGGGHRGGRLDGAGARVVLPDGDAAGRAGRRRPAGARRPLGLRRRGRAGPGGRRRRRGSAPSIPSWRRWTRSWSSGPTQWALRSTSGPSTPPRTCGPWWPPGWTPSSRTGSREALVAGGRWGRRRPAGGQWPARARGRSGKRPVTGPNGGERPWSTKMVRHERRRMRQADTRSGRPRRAESGHQHPRPVRQAHHGRFGQLRGRDGPPARLGRGRRGHPRLHGAGR